MKLILNSSKIVFRNTNPIDVNSLPQYKRSIVNGAWASGSTNTHISINIEGYSYVDIITNATQNGDYAFLSSWDESIGTASPAPTPNIVGEVVSTSKNETYKKVEIPSGAKYLYFKASYNSVSCLPQKVVLY